MQNKLDLAYVIPLCELKKNTGSTKTQVLTVIYFNK